MLRDKQVQYDCLNAIVDGKDAWPQFWDTFGKLILFDLKKFNIASGTARDDIFQELVCKLIANDKRALRRFLNNPESQGFTSYLRVILHSVVMNYFRKHGKVRESELIADGALIANSKTSNWGKDPLTTQTERVRCERVFLAVCRNERESESFQILSLRFIDQESVTYIAKRLNLKPNTVSQRIKYYLKRIEEQFGDELINVLND